MGVLGLIVASKHREIVKNCSHSYIKIKATKRR